MIKELVIQNRSYRGYDRTRPVTREELTEFVDLTRFTASSVNRQPLKYHIVSELGEVEALQACTRWARALPQLNLPFPGTEPTGFVVICQDLQIVSNETAYLRDIGIVAQTMLLAAVEKGLGGCMIGNFNKNDVQKLLELPEYIQPNLIVAFGKPAEDIRLVEAGEDGSTKYYRDENGVHYVPKRKLEDILI
ncbi:MAG: nitroreductase family protein [Clostridiales bacterium]|nr:nitroreductase family protein [Clostridiales bacterium]